VHASDLTGADLHRASCTSASGTYETYGLGEIASAFKVKPDTGPPIAEVRV